MRTEVIEAIAVFAIVIIAAFGVTVFMAAWILYDQNELAGAIIIAAALSLAITATQIVVWPLTQPPPWHWLATIRKAWTEVIVGAAMHYAAILSGASLGALLLSGNDETNGLSQTNVAMVLAQQAVVTGTTLYMFGERLRKRIRPGQPNQPAVQPNQPAVQPNQPAVQPNQPAGARKEDKQMPVVLALLALLAIVQVLLALLQVVTVLAVFASTKKGNKRRRK